MCGMQVYRRGLNGISFDLFQAFSEYMGRYVGGMMPMLAALNISHKGRHHSGIGIRFV